MAEAVVDLAAAAEVDSGVVAEAVARFAAEEVAADFVVAVVHSAAVVMAAASVEDTADTAVMAVGVAAIGAATALASATVGRAIGLDTRTDTDIPIIMAIHTGTTDMIRTQIADSPPTHRLLRIVPMLRPMAT
jgi:hypothetical protein